MSAHNTYFIDKVRKLRRPSIFTFLNYRNNFPGTQKRVRIIQGKRAIIVRVIEVLL